MTFGGFEWFFKNVLKLKNLIRECSCKFSELRHLKLNCNNKDENIHFELYLCDDKFNLLCGNNTGTSTRYYTMDMPERFENSWSGFFTRQYVTDYDWKW